MIVPDNNQQKESQEPQSSNPEHDKTSWVWKHFCVKTDGRAYCQYKVLRNDVEEPCGYNCVYNNAQTIAQQYHLFSVHKEFVRQILI